REAAEVRGRTQSAVRRYATQIHRVAIVEQRKRVRFSQVRLERNVQVEFTDVVAVGLETVDPNDQGVVGREIRARDRKEGWIRVRPLVPEIQKEIERLCAVGGACQVNGSNAGGVVVRNRPLARRDRLAASVEANRRRRDETIERERGCVRSGRQANSQRAESERDESKTNILHSQESSEFIAKNFLHLDNPSTASRQAEQAHTEKRH